MLGTADQLFFDQMEATWLADEHLVAQARANPIENFRLVFARRVHEEHRRPHGRQRRHLQARSSTTRRSRPSVMDHYLQRVFERAREPGRA